MDVAAALDPPLGILNINTLNYQTQRTVNQSQLNEANNENSILKNLTLKNSEKVIVGHNNLSSPRNKFELLTEMVQHKVDLLMISETKLDSSFQDAQFNPKSYLKSHRLDRNSKGGGIILYFREDISSKLINL